MTKPKLVQSVTRAFDFLRLVAQSEEGLTLQQLSQETDLKLPTVHNLTRPLVALGILEKSERPKRYRIGPSFLELADQYWQNTTLLRATEAVKTLSAKLDNAIISFAEYRGGDVVVLMRVVPQMPQVVQRPKSLVLSPYTSASALVFQAYWEQHTLLDFRQQYPFEEFGVSAWKTIEDLEEYLDGIRKNSYACLDYSSPPGFRVAAPAFSKHKEVVGVLGAYIYGFEEVNDQQRQKMIDYVVDAAQYVSD